MKPVVKSFRKSAFSIISGVFFILILTGSSFAESVFLKDGSIVEGKVTKETDLELQIDFPDGTNRKLLRKDIIRTLYHDDYKNKRYLNKMDGEVLEVYIVDEDKASYTYRNDLNIFNEVKILRTDVDSISKRLVPVAKDEPKKKFGVGIGFKVFSNSGSPDIPYMVSASELDSAESECKDHLAISIEPAYDLFKYLTIKTSFEFSENKIQAPGSDIDTGASWGSGQYEGGGISSTYFGSYGTIQLNIPFSGFAPFLSAGAGYKVCLNRDVINITQYGTYPNKVDYEFTPDKNNLLVYRLALGVSIYILRSVDLVFSAGFDNSIGSSFYDGFTVKRTDGGTVDSTLAKSASDLKSSNNMGQVYFEAGMSFRIF